MSYQHPYTNGQLNNLHETLEYNALGQPVMRVHASFGASNGTGAGNQSTMLDAFGRMRTSNPFTLFDSGFRYRDDSFKWDTSLAGTSAATHLPNEGSVSLAVGTAQDDSVIRETKRVFSYQPGKSLLVLNTFVMSSPQPGLRQRVGYFGAQNGIFFEVDGSTMYIVKRSYNSGSVVDTRISQSNWNVNQLQGAGIILDPSKAQIFWSDIEWLGVGSVRCGFVIDGVFVICHIFHHANILNKVYMTTASLPIRYEITNTGTTGTASAMRQICSTVISEGGYINSSKSFAASTGLTGKNLNQTTFTPLVSLKLKSAYPDAIVVPKSLDVYGLQQAAFKWRLILNPTLTSPSWTDAGALSSAEYDTSATALSGGIVLDEGIFIGGNKGGAISVSQGEVDFNFQLGRTIAGASDVLCLAALATTNNDDAVGAVTWQEHN